MSYHIQYPNEFFENSETDEDDEPSSILDEEVYVVNTTELPDLNLDFSVSSEDSTISKNLTSLCNTIGQDNHVIFSNTNVENEFLNYDQPRNSNSSVTISTITINRRIPLMESIGNIDWQHR